MNFPNRKTILKTGAFLAGTPGISRTHQTGRVVAAAGGWSAGQQKEVPQEGGCGKRNPPWEIRKSPSGQKCSGFRPARIFSAGPSRRHDSRRSACSPAAIRSVSACCPPRPRRCSAGSSPRSARYFLASRRIALPFACYSHVVCPHTPNPHAIRPPTIRLWARVGGLL